MKIIESKKSKGINCCVHGCANEPIKKKGGLCHKHYARLTKSRDRVYYRYNKFKWNAKKKGKEFFISIEEFRRFCEKTGYMIDKGKCGYNATIDRRCNAHGYHIWNIQLLTLRQNSSKGASFSGDNFDCPF